MSQYRWCVAIQNGGISRPILGQQKCFDAGMGTIDGPQHAPTFALGRWLENIFDIDDLLLEPGFVAFCRRLKVFQGKPVTWDVGKAAIGSAGRESIFIFQVCNECGMVHFFDGMWNQDSDRSSFLSNACGGETYPYSMSGQDFANGLFIVATGAQAQLQLSPSTAVFR